MRLKRSMQTFPPAPSMGTLRNQFRTLLPDSEGLSQSSLHLGQSARVTLAGPLEVEQQQQTVLQQMTLHVYMRKLRHEIAWSALDIPAVIGRRLLQQQESATGHLNKTGQCPTGKSISNWTNKYLF